MRICVKNPVNKGLKFVLSPKTRLNFKRNDTVKKPAIKEWKRNTRLVAL